jgi:hypothetical protein
MTKGDSLNHLVSVVSQTFRLKQFKLTRIILHRFPQCFPQALQVSFSQRIQRPSKVDLSCVKLKTVVELPFESLLQSDNVLVLKHP